MQLRTVRNSGIRDGFIGDRQAEQPGNFADRPRFVIAAEFWHVAGPMTPDPHASHTGLEYALDTLKPALKTHLDT